MPEYQDVCEDDGNYIVVRVTDDVFRKIERRQKILGYSFPEEVIVAAILKYLDSPLSLEEDWNVFAVCGGAVPVEKLRL